ESTELQAVAFCEREYGTDPSLQRVRYGRQQPCDYVQSPRPALSCRDRSSIGSQVTDAQIGQPQQASLSQNLVRHATRPVPPPEISSAPTLGALASSLSPDSPDHLHVSGAASRTLSALIESASRHLNSLRTSDERRRHWSRSSYQTRDQPLGNRNHSPLHNLQGRTPRRIRPTEV